ncbi:hypothetical protein ACA910_022332 [Epithemia clementina (nom. ined.)]
MPSRFTIASDRHQSFGQHNPRKLRAARPPGPGLGDAGGAAAAAAGGRAFLGAGEAPEAATALGGPLLAAAADEALAKRLSS